MTRSRRLVDDLVGTVHLQARRIQRPQKMSPPPWTTASHNGKAAPDQS
jgi:hypothetical protein